MKQRGDPVYIEFSLTGSPCTRDQKNASTRVFVAPGIEQILRFNQGVQFNGPCFLVSTGLPLLLSKALITQLKTPRNTRFSIPYC